jgi:cytoskeletal protein CcmA (bactofilin family)
MKSPSPPSNPEIPRRVVDIPGAPRRRAGEEETAAQPAAAAAQRPAPPPEKQVSERKLIVGKDISLCGEINACDHLVVEGRIEAKLKECRTIEVAGSGVFKGSAEIEEADIAGRFDGDITVRGRLRVQSSGTISGSVRYGRIEVEAGGRLIGTVQPLDEEEIGAAAGQAPAAAEPSPTAPNWQSASAPAGGVVHALSEAGELRGEPVE